MRSVMNLMPYTVCVWRSREKPPAVHKGDLHPRKEMLNIFWDVRGVVCWELLPSGATINSEVYCNQLQELRTMQNRIPQKYPPKAPAMY